MPHTKYLIVGGGMAADAAVQGIRQHDPSGTITLISSETHPPYNRPPLSKGLWKGESENSIWRTAVQSGVSLCLGRRATQLNPQEKTITDDQGIVYHFERLLIATGGSVNHLPFPAEDVIYFRTYDDYKRLRLLADQQRSFAVLGGGFIGWEIAAALSMVGRNVTLLFPGSGIGSRIFPRSLSEFLNGFYREKGVEVLPGDTATGVERRGAGFLLQTRQGRSLQSDTIVAGLGIRPNVELLQAAGFQTSNGVPVNEYLQTGHPDIYAAGDVAEFFNPALQKRLRVEHEDAANSMGQTAGANLAGAHVPYHHLPFFYSDLFDLGFEAVGELDSGMEIFEDWKEPFREGVVYYLDRGRVRGVLLWNTWGQVNHARSLIAEPGPIQPSDLKGRLPV
jgi:3-phenylpropionate/trans-cinnamate dioxygenase ferredoxin reductase subunit